MAYVEVDVERQVLRLYERPGGVVLWQVAVATAKKGVGEQYGSYQTPRGLHIIRARIGQNAPRNGVFVGRRLTGEIYSPALRQVYPERDWILTRILWLSGLEVGKNRLGKVDTMRRYIYVHGAPDEDAMGVPSSHGCVKMRNDDILILFDKIEVGTRVHIIA
ncbi:MAG TPA: L,D-transpeptidase [Acidiferrobacter sp.]|nr:L,D-transpeptidase [Acidiferrobacter sp.]